MNDGPAIMRAPILDENSPRIPDIEQPFPNNEIRESLANPFINPSLSFGYSPLTNIVSIIFIVGKIVATNYMLINISEKTCVSFSLIWLIAMLFHDIVCIFIPIMRLQNHKTLNRVNSTFNRPTTDAPSPRFNNPQDLEAMTDEQIREELNQIRTGYLQEETILRDIMAILKTTNKIKILSNICICYWAILLVLGIYNFVFDVSVAPCTDDETVKILFIVYICMAFFWVIRHVLFLVAGCLCLPIILLIYYILGKRKKQASNASIKKLPIKRYKTDFPGEKQCSICLLDYEEGNKIIQLECNSMHYFHEKCGKKWLKINGQCPICRQRIDKKKDETI